ncbi:MAG: LamG domain-containing protein [Armatimonadota bacterium]
MISRLIRCSILLIFVSLGLLLTTMMSAQADQVPLVAHYTMDPDPRHPEQTVDAGPLKLNGTFHSGVTIIDGKSGKAGRFDGTSESYAEVRGGLLDRLSGSITITMWVRLDKLPDSSGGAGIIAKRAQNVSAPFDLSIGQNGSLGFEGDTGGGWINLFTDGGQVKTGDWFHLAWVYNANDAVRFYVNGKDVGSSKVNRPLAANDQSLIIGKSPVRGAVTADIDDISIYAAPLTADQVTGDMQGTLQTRTAVADDFPKPTQPVKMALVRYDMPIGFQEGYGRTRQAAQRIEGPDAVDWPGFTFDGKPLWDKSSEQTLDLPLRQDGMERPLYQQPYDHVIQSGNYWVRALQWMWGQRYIYTTDNTARTWMSDYELWTFPVLIQGTGEHDIADVTLDYDGKTICKNAGPFHSLTLLLPQNEVEKPYELSVNGREPVRFDVGLQPIVVGKPEERVRPINLTITGTGAKITVTNAEYLQTFPNQEEWNDDQKRLASLLPSLPIKNVLAARRNSVNMQLKTAKPTAASLLAYYPMEPNMAAMDTLPDLGPLALDGKLADGAVYDGNGHKDNALKLDGKKACAVIAGTGTITHQTKSLTVTAWVRPDEMPRKDTMGYLITTRSAWWAVKPWSLCLNSDGNWGFEGHDGDRKQIWSDVRLKVGTWQHVAFTYQQGGELVCYLNGQAVKRAPVPNALTANDDQLVIGYEEGGNFQGGGRSGFKGMIDEVRIYADALSSEQVTSDMNGTLPVRVPDGMKQVTSKTPTVIANVGKPANTSSMRAHLGIDVPRSPVSVQAVALTHGMSGGAFYSSSDWLKKFEGSANDFSRYAAETGYDCIFERSTDADLITSLARNGVCYGLVPDVVWGRPFIEHPNVAFFSANLPDWHAPLYRNMQLQSQTLGQYPNFSGFNIGADNGGYTSFWDWAPPVPNRPWGEAYMQFNKGNTDVPIPMQLGGKSSMKTFIDYIARYNATFRQYGYFAKAVQEVAPSQVLTTGSFGSSPGVGGRGGWPWASMPGKAMYDGVSVQQAYDWNELSSSKPGHLVALIDRLRSYYPQKTTWAIVDDFCLFFGREPRQRAYAFALTRGVQSIGTNFLAAPTGIEAKPGTVADQRELYDWIHRYGGAYAKMEPQASIGILYVHQQALARPVNQNENASEQDLQKCSHEGKTNEAFWLCHAAGWPAKIITPDELQRGLPAGMKAILLVGLNKFDDSWVWYAGLEKNLQQFVKSGGRILLDDESVVPAGLTVTRTGMAVNGYVTQSNTDATPALSKRNLVNIGKLRQSMVNIAGPIAVSTEPTIWAVPSTSGNTQYVTVFNWGYQDGQNASVVMKPQMGQLGWNTNRPIYDMHAKRRLTAAEAATVDLTRDGFAMYALPVSEVSTPVITVSPGKDKFYYAKISMSTGGQQLTGIPVGITITGHGESVTIYSATGLTAKLPVRVGDTAGVYTVTCEELLSGLSGKTAFKLTSSPIVAVTRSAIPVQAIKVFAARKDRPLVIALTEKQSVDPAMVKLAGDLVVRFRTAGRTVRIGKAVPGDIIRSLQVVKAIQRFPQWQTVPADLVLLGTVSDNLLLYDQHRGGLLPSGADAVKNGANLINVTYSPFVGEYQALNIISSDMQGLKQAVNQVISTIPGIQSH